MGKLKKGAIALVAGGLLCGVVAIAAGSGGTASDPLVSKGFVDGSFVTSTLAQAETKIAQRHETAYQTAEGVLRTKAAQYAGGTVVAPAAGGYAPAFGDLRLKQGDVVQVGTGSGFLLLAGSAELSCTTGRVLELSNSWEQSTGALVEQRRYLAAEDTTAAITVTSSTAVLSFEGFYSVAKSAATDYNALADAMKALGLFKGGDTAYGSGYDLEKPPTRVQGLILFLRLVGEESAALATAAQCPFTDVPDWSRSYVAYAYEKGYTKGVDASRQLFGANDEMKAGDYMTFILRALGYQDTGDGADFAWDTSLQRAAELGVITAGEQGLLTRQPFLRAQAVYVSYFALDAVYKGGGETLLTRLGTYGSLDAAAAATVRGGVGVDRVK